MLYHAGALQPGASGFECGYSGSESLGRWLRVFDVGTGSERQVLASGPQLFSASDSNVEACNRNKPGCLAVVTSPRSEDMGLELLVELAPPGEAPHTGFRQGMGHFEDDRQILTLGTAPGYNPEHDW